MDEWIFENLSFIECIELLNIQWSWYIHQNNKYKYWINHWSSNFFITICYFYYFFSVINILNKLDEIFEQFHKTFWIKYFTKHWAINNKIFNFFETIYKWSEQNINLEIYDMRILKKLERTLLSLFFLWILWILFLYNNK
jgi:hypothetical protein